VPLNQVPTATFDTALRRSVESEFTLGRSAILLVPKNASGSNFTTEGVTFNAYQNFPTATPTSLGIDYLATPVVANSTLEKTTAAHITQSRIDAASTFPEQIMAFLAQAITTNRAAGNARYEADHFCYRRAALRSPYDTEFDINGNVSTTGTRNIGNGFFRMHTIALQGVPTFAVEWTDGSVYAANDIDPVTTTDPANPKRLAATSPLIGTTRWYGMNNAQSGTNTPGVVDPSGTVLAYTPPSLNDSAVTTVPANTSLDPYTAIFSFDNKAKWPVALRFRYHITDPANRLPSGREVVQVVKLPS
jgi:hypothetical protein